MQQLSEPVLSLFAALLLSIPVIASGCAVGPEPISSTAAGLNCVDDTPHCISERQGALRQLVADKSRKWIAEPPTTQAYASGVRLFAYKQTKRELSCDELAQGRKEADGAPSSLKSGSSYLSPAQISRGTMLAGEVGRELGNEMKKRCKRT